MTPNRPFLRTIIFTSILFSCISLFAQCVSYEGFASGTIVHTDTDSMNIEALQIGDLVRSQDLENGIQVVCSITHFSKQFVPSYVEIVLDHETIATAPGQKFYLMHLNTFVTAHELLQSPELRSQFPEAILEIRQVNKSIEVYVLSVAHQHNFYVTQKQLLAHNFIPFVGLAAPPAAHFVITIAGPIIGPALLQAAQAATPALGGWIATQIAKGFMGKKQRDMQWRHEHSSNDNHSDHDKTESPEKTREFSQSFGTGGPGDPNDPNKNGKGNNNQKPDDDNDDKDKEKKEDDDEKIDEKKNESEEQKKSENGDKKGELSESKPQSPQDIADHIAANENAILDSIESALKELAKNDNFIKEIGKDSFNIKHIFSAKHIRNGLMKLNNDIKSISKNAIVFSIKIITIVGNADKLNLLKEEMNTIRTYMNELPVEVHVFIKNNTVTSFNAFAGHSTRIAKNLIEI